MVGAQQADPQIALEQFLEDEIVGVAKPGLLPLEHGQLDPRLIGELTLLSREEGSSSRELVEAELRTAGVWPRDCWELGSPEAIKRAARAGLGIAFLSSYAVAEDVESGQLESFRLEGRAPLRRSFFIARPAGRALAPSTTRSPLRARVRRDTHPLLREERNLRRSLRRSNAGLKANRLGRP
jgi:LysR family transcriptional regulator, low CO2-responsive transcriptional regulator